MNRILDNYTDFSFLVIEDNYGDFVLLEDFLIEGFKSPKIKHCSDMSSAIQVIESERSSLSIIFLDLHLPDGQGIELAKKILWYAGKVPVIILTGYADLSIAHLSLKLGVYDFLIKDELNVNFVYKSVEFALSRRYFIAQIENERAKFESLFNFSPQATWLIDYASLQILDANYYAINKYGFSIDEFRAMNIVDLHPAEDQSLIKEKIKAGIFDGKEASFVHYLKNGNQIDVELHLELADIGGNNKALIVQANDITKALQHTRTIEQQNKRFKNIAWTQSHVVRAPLSRMLGIVHLLEIDKDSMKDYDMLLQQLKESAEEMDNIIQKIVRETNESLG